MLLFRLTKMSLKMWWKWSCLSEKRQKQKTKHPFTVIQYVILNAKDIRYICSGFRNRCRKNGGASSQTTSICGSNHMNLEFMWNLISCGGFGLSRLSKSYLDKIFICKKIIFCWQSEHGLREPRMKTTSVNSTQ